MDFFTGYINGLDHGTTIAGFGFKLKLTTWNAQYLLYPKTLFGLFSPKLASSFVSPKWFKRLDNNSFFRKDSKPRG